MSSIKFHNLDGVYATKPVNYMIFIFQIGFDTHSKTINKYWTTANATKFII